MIYGTKQLKNGKRKGILKFDSGKIINLSPAEVVDLENKIREWNMYAKLKIIK